MLNAVTDRPFHTRKPRLLTPSEVGQLVRVARKSRRWSQEALAAEASVTHRTVQRIEAGEPSDLQTRRGVARALVPVCEVMRQAAACDWDERGGGASGGSQPG
jgi:ribosome-binding protein aMBF1 (putative translation factor)